MMATEAGRAPPLLPAGRRRSRCRLGGKGREERRGEERERRVLFTGMWGPREMTRLATLSKTGYNAV